MENRPPADQLDHPALDLTAGRGNQLDHPALGLIAARGDLFSRQGHVAVTWRHRNGKTFGPYYRLSYREEGRQRSIYLGREGELVEHVRRALRLLQQPLAESRALGRLQRQIRASLRVERLRLATLLHPYGLWLKGFEVRGWRFCSLRPFLPPRRPLVPRATLRRPARRRRKTDAPAARILRFLAARDEARGLAQGNGAE